MSLWQELASWKTPPVRIISDPPRIGTKAPSHPSLELPIDNKGAVVIFLRHCGCPFAEKAYRDLTNHPAIRSGEVIGIAVSHSSEEATNKWIEALKNDPKHPLSMNEQSPVRVIVDEERRIYGAWGLGVSSVGHVLSPSGMASVLSLGWSEGIWNRPTESGSRWQMAGDFAVDKEGVVRWVHVYETAGDVGDINEGVQAVLKSEGGD